MQRLAFNKSMQCGIFAITFGKLRKSASIPISFVRSMQLTPDSINPKVLEAQYAVRGALVLRAMQHERALQQKQILPFSEILYCNIGNPHQLKQKPVTFFRQVLALTDYPDLLDMPGCSEVFPADAIQRAKEFHRNTPGGTGAYSESQGLRHVRENVAKFIARRDGVTAYADDIFLTDGASQGVHISIMCLIKNELDGIMIPIPQYPLYTATISLNGGRAVGYYLDESHGWTMDVSELDRALREARNQGTNVRALAVINPGNPTGQCLTEANIRQVVEFCERNNLVILADEVYQANVYGNVPFTSFRKVVTNMKSNVELISYHSVSKGMIGECGRRGGYMELINIDPVVVEQIYKLFSISLCSNIAGQIIVDLMVSPPSEGDPSYDQYEREMKDLFESLKRRSQKLHSALNSMKNITCTEIGGAMYAFPSIHLPPSAVQAAKEAGMTPDTFYAVELLDATGICVVPGSGFRQKQGSFHFRTTFLPSESKMDDVIDKLRKFNQTFMDKYS
uniref:Aminotransferase class I/classII large domain-containing protein n=1 Tax=Hanusia phi TaxID=3032 RepID=A0A7S0E8I1_9CRYP|mmetsp:Transcript_17659/g.39927  ORF Transcript_17659/g.39927 Transcript_17659/m.39927 type:complete len:509 (+) Transcript_17659:146-1672(+)